MTSIRPVASDPPIGRPRRQAGPEAAAPPQAQGRALVPVSAVESTADDHRRPSRASAAYLAQLIANERQLPQTRERRRAEPLEAIAAYGAAARLTRRR